MYNTSCIILVKTTCYKIHPKKTDNIKCVYHSLTLFLFIKIFYLMTKIHFLCHGKKISYFCFKTLLNGLTNSFFNRCTTL